MKSCWEVVMKEETTKDRFLKACVITGGIPYPESKDFFHSDYMRRKLTQEMLRDGLISCKRNEFGKHYTDTKRADELLLCNAMNFGLLFYMMGNKYINHPISNPVLCNRKYNRAVTLLTMLKADIAVYPFYKPDLFGIEENVRKEVQSLDQSYCLEKQRTHYTDKELYCIAADGMIAQLNHILNTEEKRKWYLHLKQLNQPEDWKDFHQERKSFFYCSLEIKGDNKYKSINISGSRAIGALITQRRVYLVYYLKNQLIKWSSGLETGMKATIGTIFYKESQKPDKGNTFSFDYIKGLFLIDDLDVIYSVLENSKKQGNTPWLSLDGTFDGWYFLHRKLGDFQLKVMTDLEKEKELLLVMLKNEPIKLQKDSMHGKDGTYGKSNSPVSFQYFMEVEKMIRFHQYLELTKSKGIVYCLPYQIPFFDKFYESFAIIKGMKIT